MSEGARQKLARLRKIRLLTAGGKLRQIPRTMLMPLGSRLLIPRDATLRPPGPNHAAIKSRAALPLPAMQPASATGSVSALCRDLPPEMFVMAASVAGLHRS